MPGIRTKHEDSSKTLDANIFDMDRQNLIEISLPSKNSKRSLICPCLSAAEREGWDSLSFRCLSEIDKVIVEDDRNPREEPLSV
jgi:hypothetical protein